MRPGAGDASKPQWISWRRHPVEHLFSTVPIERDLKHQNYLRNKKYIAYWETRPHCPIPYERFENYQKVYLEIGAGSGDFGLEIAAREPDSLFVGVDRDRHRGKALVRRSDKSGLNNFAGLRGNIIPALTCGMPSNSLDKIFILYPCPFSKVAQRKNRWYFHPMMAHVVRCLKPGGVLVWASDQKPYIDEAQHVCSQFYDLETLVHGLLAPNPFNGFRLTRGRTKFENQFLREGQPCYELVVKKPSLTKDKC